MKLNQQLLKINRNFLVCFVVSASVSAITAQTFSDFPAHINTTITISVGYVSFFAIFLYMFYHDNKARYRQMSIHEIKKELVKLVSSLGVGEIFYLIIRWFLQFYFLENGFEPYLASLTSEIISTSFYMGLVSVILRVTKTY